MNKARKTIYYDGNCAACSNIMLRVKHSKKNDVFTTVDYHIHKLPQGITEEELSKEIHVIDSNGGLHRNFDAILEILDEYPHWKALVVFFRLPFFYQLGLIGYKIFAANRHLVLGKAGRLFWVKIVVALGFLIALLITYKLWLTGRSFPLVPVIPLTFNLPSFLDYYIFFALIILLFFIMIFPNPRKTIFLFAAIFFILVFFDINRLQIFNYQYIFMLLALGLFSWNYKDTVSTTRILNICRLMIICIYFWGGLQKLNLYFFLFSFPWVIEPVIKITPNILHSFIYFSGTIVPFLESGIGIGLFFKKTRIYAILGATILHCMILFTLGPLGHNYAPSIWPWNVVMILLVYLLFWNETTSFKNLFWIENDIFQNVILVLFGILPFFSFFNFWDTYLSFSMYAGNINYAYMDFTNNNERFLPSEISRYLIKQDNKHFVLDIPVWGYDELGVLPYPESRVYKKVGADVCNYIADKKDARLIIEGKKTVFDPDKAIIYTCKEI